MKEGIHPKYGDATITCACGNVIHTRSTKPEMQVNTCSACHPYFTGQKTMVREVSRFARPGLRRRLPRWRLSVFYWRL